MTGIVAIYLIHSTVLLVIAWIVDRRCRLCSFSEHVWKCAAVFGVITPAIQVAVLAISPQLRLAPIRPLPRVEGLPHSGEFGNTKSQKQLVRPTTQEIRQKEALQRSPSSVRLGVQKSGRHTKELTDEEAAVGRDINPSVAALASNLRRIGLSQGDIRKNSRFLQPVIARVALFGLGLCFVLGTSLILIQLLRLHRCFLHAEVVSDGPVRRSLDNLIQRTSTTMTVRLLIATNCPEPLAFGFFRWNIVLPKDTIERLAAAEIDALLAHEMAHLVRRDFLWLWVGKLLCCCAPFQPLNFLARRRWQKAAEYLCDDWAVAHGVESLCLARCLVVIAEWRLKPQPCMAVFASGPTHSTLFHRVRRLISRESDSVPRDWQRRGARTTVVAVASLLVLFAPCAASPGTRTPPALGAFNLELRESHRLLERWETLETGLKELDRQIRVVQTITSDVTTQSSTQRLIHQIDLGAKRLCEERNELRRLINELADRVESLHLPIEADNDVGSVEVRSERLSVHFADYPSRKSAQNEIARLGNDVVFGRSLDNDWRRFGWTLRNEIQSDSIRNVLSTLPVGMLSAIIEDDRGLHLVRVLERKQ